MDKPSAMPVATGPHGATLTVSYRSPNADEPTPTRYAIVPFPQTYEEAVTSALKLLGKYIAGLSPGVNQVILRSSAKNREGEWIWVDFDPSNWLLVAAPGSEVGLFEAQPRALDSNAPFWGGQVYLVFGETKGGLTTWSRLDPRNHAHLINRPGSYAEAVEAIKRHAAERVSWIKDYPAIKAILDPGKTLPVTFYEFKNPAERLTEWLQFPSVTTTNEDAWKAFVPLPHGVLGVVAT
ncbi:hypothetical protein C8R46DRAFT_1075010 [Mycena filopes]|nr:hypothetical protein C8R46DRAFT_1075010 [Mycena filopes]